MGSEHARRFWSEGSEYQDLAQAFEENISVTHPKYVTSDGVGHRIIAHDAWCASKVTYREYTGPNIDSLKFP